LKIFDDSSDAAINGFIHIHHCCFPSAGVF